VDGGEPPFDVVLKRPQEAGVILGVSPEVPADVLIAERRLGLFEMVAVLQ
jgi:hypothetical protein